MINLYKQYNLKLKQEGINLIDDINIRIMLLDKTVPNIIGFIKENIIDNKTINIEGNNFKSDHHIVQAAEKNSDNWGTIAICNPGQNTCNQQINNFKTTKNCRNNNCDITINLNNQMNGGRTNLNIKGGNNNKLNIKGGDGFIRLGEWCMGNYMIEEDIKNNYKLNLEGGYRFIRLGNWDIGVGYDKEFYMNNNKNKQIWKYDTIIKHL